MIRRRIQCMLHGHQWVQVNWFTRDCWNCNKIKRSF